MVPDTASEPQSPAVPGVTPVPAPAPDIDSVAVRRDKYRRRIDISKLFGAFLGAGLTLFTAVKLSEGGLESPLARWTGVLFLTAVFASAVLLFFSFGKVQWQLDLIGRYLAEDKSSPRSLTLTMTMSEASQRLSDLKATLHEAWPPRAHAQFVASFVAGATSAVLLLVYVWLPVLPGGTAKDNRGESVKPQVIATNLGSIASVHFDKDRSVVPPEAAEVVRAIARRVSPVAEECLHVSGYSDSDGSGNYNVTLSQLRTEAIRTILSDEQFPSSRVVSVAYGETRPQAVGESASAKAQNRRVDIEVVPCSAVAQPSGENRGQ